MRGRYPVLWDQGPVGIVPIYLYGEKKRKLGSVYVYRVIKQLGKELRGSLKLYIL